MLSVCMVPAAFAAEKSNTSTKNQYLCENVANSLSDPNVIELDGYTYKLEKWIVNRKLNNFFKVIRLELAGSQIPQR